MERKCENCRNGSTPSGKQCGTLTKAIKNIEPFYPENVIPVMDKLAKRCSRFMPREAKDKAINCVGEHI